MEDNNVSLAGMADWSLDLNKGIETSQQTPTHNPSISDINFPVLPELGGSQGMKPKVDKLTQDSQALDASIYGAIGRGPSASPRTSFIGDTKRYDAMYPGQSSQELEDIYAKQQGAIATVGAGLKNMGLNFTKTLVQGVTEPIVGSIAALSAGKGSAFYDNPWNKWLESWEDVKSPIYESTARKNAPWYSSKTWWSPNVLSSAMETFGDIAGIAATVYLTGKVATGLGAGRVSETLGTRYMNSVAKLQELQAVLPEGEAGIQVTKELSEGLNRIRSSAMADAAKLDESTKLITDLSKKYSTQLKTYNKFLNAAIGTVGNLGIASGSALQASSHFRENLIDKIHQEGREVSEEEQKKIDEMANDVGAWTGALMTTMGAITLHGMFKGILAKGDGETLVRNEINAIQEGTEKDLGEGLGKVPQYEGAKPEPYTGNKVQQLGQKLWRGTKASPSWIQKRVDLWPGIGMAEFGLVSPSVESYYDKKYREGDASVLSDAITPNLKNLLTKEGIGSFLLGVVSAVPFEVVGKAKGRGEIDKNTSAAINSFNTTYLRSNLKAQVDCIKRGKVLRQEYLDAIRSGDKEQELTLRSQQIENYLYPRIKYGQKALVDKDIQGYRKMTETAEGMQQLQSEGILSDKGNLLEEKERFLKELDKIQKYADNAENYYQALTLKWGGYVDKSGKKVFDDAHIEKLMFLSGGIDRINMRVKDLAAEISTSELSAIPEFQKRFSLLLNQLEGIKLVQRTEGAIGEKAPKELIDGIYNDIEKLQVTADQKDELSKKFGDYLKLNLRKKMYLDEYSDIISQPGKYADTVRETPIQTTTQKGEEKIPGNYVLGVKTKNKEKVDFKIGEQYIGGEKIVPGKYGEDRLTKFRDFLGFTVVGEKVEDGKRSITIRTTEGLEQDIPEAVFAKYKFGKVEDLKKNRNANYWYNNRNTVYDYPIYDKETGKYHRVEGRLNYDPESDEFKFVYTDEDGKRHETLITKDQFRPRDVRNEKGEVVSRREAKLRKKGEITEADQEFIDAKETEREKQIRDKKLEEKRQVIADLISDKQVELNKADKQIKEHSDTLKTLKKDLKEVKSSLEDAKGTNYEDVVLSSIKDLQSLIKETNESIRKSVASRDILSAEMEDLNELLGIQDETAPLGRAFLEELDQIKKEFERAILETDKQIASQRSYMDSAIDTLKQLLSGAKKIARKVIGAKDIGTLPEIERFIESEYPDIETTGYAEQLPDYSPEVNQLKAILRQRRDIKTDLESRRPEIMESIKELEESRDKFQKQLNLVRDIIDKFDTRYRDFLKEQAKQRLFAGAYKKNLSGRQKQLDIRANGTNGIDTPEQWQEPAMGAIMDPKKSVLTVYASSIAPSQLTSAETEFYKSNNYWSRRYDNFLKNFNLLQEGKEGHIADRGNLKVIAVTKTNQHHYFGDKKFIPDSYKDFSDNTKDIDNSDHQRGAIALVMVYDTPEGLYTVDENGKLLTNLADPRIEHNPEEFIYTYLENAIPERTGEYKGTKYFLPEGTTELQEQEIAKQALEKRKSLIEDPNQSDLYSFTQSRGIPNVSKEPNGTIIRQYNSVSSVGLVPKEALKGSIIIPTVADEENQKKKLQLTATGDRNVNMPVGYPILSYRGNTSFLNSKKFSPKEAKTMFKVFRAMADNFVKNNGKLDYLYTDYLSSVFYFKDPGKEQPSRNQIWLDEEGNLVLGVNRVAIKFSPDDISANEVLLTTFLENAYHQTGKAPLKESSYTEIYDVDATGNPITRNWRSYEHYLLSDTYELSDPNHEDNGKQREGILPLTVDIKAPETDHDTPFINKYITIHNLADYHITAPKVEEKVPEKKEESSVQPVDVDTTKPVTVKFAPLGEDQPATLDGATENTFTSKSGNVYVYTAKMEKGVPVVTVRDSSDKEGNPIPDTSNAVKAIVKAIDNTLKEIPKVETPDVPRETLPTPEPVVASISPVTISDRAAKRVQAAQGAIPKDTDASLTTTSLPIRDVSRLTTATFEGTSMITPDPDRGLEYSQLRDINEATRKTIMHGLSWQMIQNLKSRTGDLVRMAEGTIPPSKLFNDLYKSMEEFYENPDVPNGIYKREQLALSKATTEAEKQAIQAGTDKALDMWEYIKKNKEGVNKDLTDFFRKHKIVLRNSQVERLVALTEDEVTQQETEDAPIVIQTEDNTIAVEDSKDRGYDRDELRIDAKQNAPVEIKILFSFLTRTVGNPNLNKPLSADLIYPEEYKTDMMLPELVDSGKYIYQVLDDMAGLTNLTDMQNNLKVSAKKEPVLVRLYNNIFTPNPTWDNWKLRLKFLKFAGKQQIEFAANRITEDGESYIMDTDFAKDHRELLDKWQSDIRANTRLVSGTKGEYKLNTSNIKSVPKDEKSTIAFLKELEFPVADDIMQKLGTSKSKLVSETAAFRNLLMSGDSNLRSLSRKALDAQGPLGQIAKLLVQAEGTYKPGQHQNIEGNTVQRNILHSNISRMLSKISTAGTLDNLLKKIPRLVNDTWSGYKNGHSMLLKKGGPLYKEDGTLKDKNLQVTLIEGMLNDQDKRNPNSPTSSMTKPLRFITMLNMNLGQRGKGIFYNSIPADSNMETGLKINHYISAGQYKDGSYRGIAENALIGYLEDEIDLIKENIAGTRKLTDNVLKGDAYKKLQTFRTILPDLVQRIEDHAQGENPIPTKEFIKGIRKEITTGIWDYIDGNLTKEKNFMDTYRILEQSPIYGDSIRKDLEKNSFYADDLGFEKMYYVHGLSTGIRKTLDIGSKDGKGKLIYTGKEVDDILRFRRLNLMIHNTEMRKLFDYGPWYEIPDATKRDKQFQSGVELTYTGEDFNKFATENLNTVGSITLQPGDIGYHKFSDTLPVMVVDHDKGVISRNYKEIEEAIGDKAKPYTHTEEADAQGIMLDTHWREFTMKSGGEWREVDELQHQYDTAMARLANAERGRKYTDSNLRKHDEQLRDIGNPGTYGTGTVKKPQGAGSFEDSEQTIPFIIKTSVMRLTYPIAKDRGLEDLYWFMHDNSIGLIGPKSYMKAGRPADLPNLYDEEGKFSLNTLTQEEMNRLRLPVNYQDFSKIVETAKSKQGKSMGSQLRSLAILNSFDNGLPVDFYKPGDDYTTKLQQWNNLSEQQKRETSDRYRLFKDNDSAISQIVQRGYDEALDRLGITEKDGQYDFTNPEKVVKFLRDEIVKRDLPSNLAAGLNWKFNQDTGREELEYPMEALPNYAELKSMIWSVVDKNIIRPRLNGGDYTLVSSALWEKGVREVVDFKGKKRLVSSELKFYKRGEIVDGKRQKTSVMQVMIGNVFRTKLEEWKERNPDKKILSDQELLSYLNRTKEGKKLLRGVGFRIPTQGLNSVDAFEIVDFLPADMGDAVVVPSEIVTKVGSDFDIDKLGVYHYNSYIDESGYPRYIDFIPDTASDKDLGRLYRRMYTEKERREAPQARLLSTVFGKSGIGEDVPTEAEFIEKYRGADPYTVNTREALENKYFETLEDIITHPDNYEQLIIPNDSKQMTDIERHINNLLEPGKESKGVDYANLLDPVYMTNERQLFMEAKSILIGIAAQNNTFHALSQTQAIFIEPSGKASDRDMQWLGDLKIYLPHNQLKVGDQLKTVHSGLRDKIGGYISDKISQYINGAVDAVKDPWLMRLIKDKDLMSTAIFLDRVGVDPNYVFTFINQPIIQDYIRENAIQRSVRGLNPDMNFRFEDGMVADVRRKYYDTSKNPVVDRKENFTLRDMEEVLKYTGENKDLNENQRILQIQILDEYMKYRTMADHSLKDQMAIMWGNMKSPDSADIKIKEKRIEHARDFSILQSADKILTNTFQGQIRDAMKKAAKGVEQILPLSEHPALDHILDTFGNMDLRISNDDRIKALDRAELSLLDYGIQTLVDINGKKLNTFIKPLLIDTEKHLGKLLNEKRKGAIGDLAKLLQDNLKHLNVRYKFRPDDIKNIELTNKPVTAYESDMLTEAFRELKNNPDTKPLYDNLVVLGLLQTGIRDSRISFNKYIPYEDYLKYARPAVDRLLSEDVGAFADTKAFYRDNWRDNSIVPAMTKQRPFRKNTDLNNIAQKLSEASGLNPSTFQIVHEKANMLKYPVVKTTGIGISPETGNKYTAKETEDMARKGDYSFLQTKLYQRVEEGGKPIAVSKDKYGNNYYLYKQINAWGDGNTFQEYYSKEQPSVLAKHDRIAELSDDQIMQVIRTGEYIPHVEEETTSPIVEPAKPSISEVREYGKQKETIDTSPLSAIGKLKEDNKQEGNKPKKC